MIGLAAAVSAVLTMQPGLESETDRCDSGSADQAHEYSAMIRILDARFCSISKSRFFTTEWPFMQNIGFSSDEPDSAMAARYRESLTQSYDSARQRGLSQEDSRRAADRAER